MGRAAVDEHESVRAAAGAEQGRIGGEAEGKHRDLHLETGEAILDQRIGYHLSGGREDGGNLFNYVYLAALH